ncbi:MAG: hypothetical protein HeimC2_13250 [Candidatus Heimdallarchaeota archaeon LC_2]|nr:MAG: hypothetical protein HeimC2_13250 [Candidatus Heimdallarchaeota archaeon LC_2]
MSEIDKLDETFTSKGIFREETLYYDLGYRFAQLRGRKPYKSLNFDLTGYLLVISLILHIVYGIQQIFTIGVMIVFILYSSLFGSKDNKSASTAVLTILFISNVFDHIIGNVFISPGLLIEGRLTVTAWILELCWILLFSTQIMLTLQPTTPVFLPNFSVQPETVKARTDFDLLKYRTSGTDFQIDTVDSVLNLELLKINLINLLRTVGLIVLVALIFDIIIWEILGSFGGGSNIVEQYFISGLILVLFLFILLSSGMLFGDEEEDEEDTITQNVKYEEFEL